MFGADQVSNMASNCVYRRIADEANSGRNVGSGPQAEINIGRFLGAPYSRSKSVLKAEVVWKVFFGMLILLENLPARKRGIG